MIEASGVTKAFAGIVVVDDLHLTLSKGEFVAVTGPSGSGKSTLLGILTGRIQPDAGVVRVDSADVHDWELVRRTRLGIVEQDHHLVPFLTALENVALALELRGGPRADLYDRAQFELEALGLASRLHGRPAELSGGERQRVAVARALVSGPEFVIADEPTAALDQTATRKFARSLRHLADNRDVGLLVATHDPLVWEQADRIVRVDIPVAVGS